MATSTKTAGAFHVLTVDKKSNTLRFVREFDKKDYSTEDALKYVAVRTRRRKIDADSVKHIVRDALPNGEPNLHGVKQPG